MKPAESFEQYYQTDLLPHLTELEEKRKVIVGKVKKTGLVTALVTLAVAAPVMIFTRQPAFGLIPLVIGLIVFFVIYTRIVTAYVTEFKGSIIDRIVRFVNPNLTYHPKEYIPQSTYWRSRIFLQDPDRYRGEDMVRGMVGETAIQFSEIHSEYKTETTDSKGNRKTQWHTIFKGIFFVADFNKHFQGETVVLPDVAERLLGRLGQKLQSWNVGRSGQLVKLEDVAFEKHFVVYADDQVEARYLLSPSLMARIVAYKERTGSAIFLSFVASHIFVAITKWRDSFEPKLFRSVLDMKATREYLDDLLMAVGIVEELNLNTRIWTKA